MTMRKKATMADVRRIAAQHGGRVVSDGMGGYEVLAPPDRKWIDAEVQCSILALNEYDHPGEKDAEIQRCFDEIDRGHEPYGG